MDIYLATEYADQVIEYAELELQTALHYDYDLEKTIEMLEKKDSFLIDTFHTFIEPIATMEEDMTYERRGVVALLRMKEVRKGFKEFLEYYSNKTLGIHSDAATRKDFERINKEKWNFGEDMLFFGQGYLTYSSKRGVIKNFERMIEETGLTKEQTLIIGDGQSDIVPAYLQNVDLLLVPNFNVQRKFDYKTLIPNP